MADGAAHLVDRVLPLAADYRQWTLSFPRWLRIRLLRDKALTSEVLAVFVRIVSAYHRRRARERGFPGGQTGAVTAIQLGTRDARAVAAIANAARDNTRVARVPAHDGLASSVHCWLSW